MADTRLSDLSAAGALSASDLFYVVQTPGSGGEKATGTQLLTLVGTTYVPLAGGTMTGALTIASGALTASAPALNVTQTWNNAAVQFIGVLWDFNDTSSDISYPLIIRTSGSNICYLTKTGDFYALNYQTLLTTGYYSWGSAGNLRLYRDAAGTLAQRNGTNAQTLRVYGTYTDSSNYERLTLSTTAGASVNLTAETLGTGGDNLDIVLTPAGTGKVKFPAGSYVDAAGFFYGVSTAQFTGLYSSTTFSLNIYNNGIQFSSVGQLYWSSGAVSAAADLGLRRSAAGVLDIDSGTSTQYRDLKLRNLIQTEYSQLTEMTAPSAPATNSVRIYAEDNGAGKTRLMALFATGAAQQIAIEP